MKSLRTDGLRRRAETRFFSYDLPRAANAGSEQYSTSASRKWLTTFPAALPDVREAALRTLAEMRAEIAYLYEAEDKVVIRATQPQRQIRAELAVLDPSSTRVVVASLQGTAVDRPTSAWVIAAMERILEAPGVATASRNNA
ncbi:MAG: hypothetical protein EHM59_17735 [Betaproteobacteria bacterium]|nr:MAG: hypothetical protein EHM59_17735 [Betaproteobacteria bacterium]